MADNQFEVPQAMRDLAKQNMEQAHTAYGQFTDFVARAMNAWMGAMPANPMAIGVKNVQDQAMEFVTLQTQFAQECMQAFFAQTQQLFSVVQESSEKRESSEKAEHGAMGALPSDTVVIGFKNAQGHVVEMAKKNAESASALVEKITKAQNTQEILTLQMKFVQEQMQAFVDQTQQLYALIGEALQKSARA